VTSSPSELSLWWDSLERIPPLRDALDGDREVDVCIVGGGFTGLWSAYYLLEADPTLRVLILEAERCGFGASGRNGGWASALFSASDARLVRDHGLDAARAMRQAMAGSIDEIERVTIREGIDARMHKGGCIVAARGPAQLARGRAEVEEARLLGVDPDVTWLNEDEARARVAMSDLLGAEFTPNCAALDPVRLVLGLADAVEARGATIAERTRVRAIEEGSPSRRATVRTEHGTVRAEVVIRATEGWSSQLKGSRRAVLPVYSLMIATEPLTDETFEDLGLRERETFADFRNLVIYGQRTADGRLAFGGRGAPYHFGSKIEPSFDRDALVFAALRETLIDLLPAVAGAAITHSWGGPVGIPRDWHSSVGLDRSTGIAWAGGYVGDGVTTTNLAGRTLAAAITETPSALLSLPWVNHRSRRWEPEPLRWLGVNAGLMATRWADGVEARRGRPSKLSGALAGLLGG